MEGFGLSQGMGLAQPQNLSMDDDQLNAWVDQLLKKNTKLNFVDRIVRPDLYPTLEDGEGGMKTHLMSWGTMGDKKTPIVYPSVIFDPETQKLQELDPDAAYEHAIKTKEYLPFPNEQAADLFSREYKRHWRDGKGPKGYQP
jgi:hypothetical protein